MTALTNFYSAISKIGIWSLVFPLASYANAWSVLSRDMRNDGMRGWAAFLSVLVVLEWLFCAAMTVYRGLWVGGLFFEPGLKELIAGPGGRGKDDRGGNEGENGGKYGSRSNGWRKGLRGRFRKESVRRVGVGDEELGNGDGSGN